VSLGLKSRQSKGGEMNAERLFELLIDSSAKFTQKEAKEGWRFCREQNGEGQAPKNGLVAHPCLCFQGNCYQVDTGTIKRISSPLKDSN
jgi:hypothetical protein